MNIFTFSLFALLLSTSAFAYQIRGTVAIFSGRYVETGEPYCYAALKTQEGGRIGLPSWINARALAKFKNNVAVFDANIEDVICTDMSSACLTGRLVDIRSASISLAKSSDNNQSFSGQLQRHAGVAVESSAKYDYISIGQDNIAVPNFLTAQALLELKAELSVLGVPNYLMCTEMSEACGPTELSSLSSVEIKF